MASSYGGIWPAVLTPIGPDGRPHLDAVERLTDLFATQKLGGLYVTGSTGQWPLLGIEDRKAVVERVVKAAAGRLPVMVHVGATALDDAVALARHAESVNADAISSVTPIYYSYGPDVVFEAYRQVGASTGLPLYVYHFSGANTLKLDPADYARRVLELPNIAGMKYTDLDLYTLGVIHATAGERLFLFSGADEVMCQAVLSGAGAAIGTFYNVWGPACQTARERFAAGDVALGQSFQLRFQTAIHRVLRSGSIWSFMRAAMQRKYGIDVGMPRAPLGVGDKPWSDAAVEEVLALVDGAN
jgi:N-acetylneuraminate lyase